MCLRVSLFGQTARMAIQSEILIILLLLCPANLGCCRHSTMHSTVNDLTKQLQMLEIPTYPIIYMCIGCMGKSSINIRFRQNVCERVQVAALSGIDGSLSSVAISTHLLHCTQPINLQLMQSKCCCAPTNTKINQPCAELAALWANPSANTQKTAHFELNYSPFKERPSPEFGQCHPKMCAHAHAHTATKWKHKKTSPMLNAHLHTSSWSTSRTHAQNSIS